MLDQQQLPFPVKKIRTYLRTVPPFVSAQPFCISRDNRVSQGICPLIQQHFCVVYDYMEKVDLSKGYQNPKSIKFGKKLPYILCILAHF